MKNRVLLAMLIVFIVLAGIWITCGTIFVVHEIDIVDETTLAEPLSDDEKSHLADAVNLKGKNILFNLQPNKITARVKSLNPMLKVQNVKAEFPNRVIIKIARRVPFYYDSDNERYFDADMCVVDNTMPNCINITAAKLNLTDNLNKGDLAVGKDDSTNCKIEQLRILAGYIVSDHFDTRTDFAISYKEDLYLRLEFQIKGATTFAIRTSVGDDFSKIFAYTYRVYHKEKNDEAGIYEAQYNDDGKIVVQINGDKYHEK